MASFLFFIKIVHLFFAILALIAIWDCGGFSGPPNIAFKPKLDVEAIHDDLLVSYGRALRQGQDGEAPRLRLKALTEYETRILASCSVKGGGRAACA